MPDKTAKPDFDKAARKRPHRNISEWNMNKKLDQYKSLAKLNKKPEQAKKVEQLRTDFYDDKSKTNVNRSFQQANLDLGHRAGLHPNTTRESLKEGYKQEDQVKRERTADQAKAKYHRNFSVSRNFNEKASISKQRNIEPDR